MNGAFHTRRKIVLDNPEKLCACKWNNVRILIYHKFNYLQLQAHLYVIEETEYVPMFHLFWVRATKVSKSALYIPHIVLHACV